MAYYINKCSKTVYTRKKLLYIFFLVVFKPVNEFCYTLKYICLYLIMMNIQRLHVFFSKKKNHTAQYGNSILLLVWFKTLLRSTYLVF